MINFESRQYVYEIPHFLSFKENKEFINYIQNETSKKLSVLENDNLSHTYNLCAIPLEGMADMSLVKDAIIKSIINLINQSENTEIEVYSIESTPVVLDKTHYKPYSCFILRGNL